MTMILLTLSLIWTGIVGPAPHDTLMVQTAIESAQRGDEGSGPWP